MNDDFFLKRYESWGYPQQPDATIPIVIRLNTLKKSATEILQSFPKDISVVKKPFLDFGYEFNANFSPVSTPQYLKGHIYIQEAASQLAVQVLDPKPGEVILDSCAAPGSKTTYIAQSMQNRGTLIANDSQSARLEKLYFNLERCGVTNTFVMSDDATMCPFPHMFDKILIDAPCSGNFVTDKTWFSKRIHEDIKQKAKQQKFMVTHVSQFVKPGGILLYCTCSLEMEENEEVVEYILDTTDLELVPIDSIGEPGLTDRTKNCKRLWPSVHNTQGFFMAKFVKKNP